MEINTPWVMGILNTTPDSFYDGGKHIDFFNALQKCEEMLNDGAKIIDIGGQSSKPGAQYISIEEELNRTIPLIEEIMNRFPNAIISIDTFQSKVAEYALMAGASVVNDISAGDDDISIFDVVEKYQAVYIAMHKKGNPQNMQLNPQYQNVSQEVFSYLLAKKKVLIEKGINDIILDVGFGFGKTIQHNYQLLNNLTYFRELDCPILVGLSRKSMIYKVLNTDAKNALNGTSVLNTIALMQGAHILRVHDVKEAFETIKLVNELNISNKI
ncbi:MAG: dihydropteroate synthase [Bacteroidota bacterium]|nr:dihydropteroate synthase [Bacteroidota bacterium]